MPAQQDLDYQAQLLQDVSRTFALTIPQLPKGARDSYGNTYLLCRITDTIEDEPTLSVTQKDTFFARFSDVVEGRADADEFARDFGAALSSSPVATPSERKLVADTARVIRVTHGLNANQRQAIERCIRIMGRGMLTYQERGTAGGLEDVVHLDRYCYHVAGIVGETKTELFCDHSAKMAERREELLELSVSFGEGLQIVNILKDIWGDWERGDCWLPRQLFAQAGYELEDIGAGKTGPAYTQALVELIALAHGHLVRILRYILLTPRRDAGIRLYSLWTLGLAILTLRRIYANPEYRSVEEVEPSRYSVLAYLFMTRLLVRSNLALRLLFWGLTRKLPRKDIPHFRAPSS